MISSYSLLEKWSFARIFEKNKRSKQVEKKIEKGERRERGGNGGVVPVQSHCKGVVEMVAMREH